MMRSQNAIIFSTPKMDNQSGNSPRNSTLIFKIIFLLSLLLLPPSLTFTNFCPSNLPKKNSKSISNLRKFLKKNLPENKLRLLWLITIPIKKEIKNITFGIVSISVPKIKNKKKQHSLDAILNLMSVILLLISLMIKMVHFSVYSLLEVAVLMALIAVFIIGFPVCKIVNSLISIKIFLVELGLAHIEKI